MDWLTAENGFSYGATDRPTRCVCPKDYWHPTKLVEAPNGWTRRGNPKHACSREWNAFARDGEFVWQCADGWLVSVAHGYASPKFATAQEACDWAWAKRPAAREHEARRLAVRAEELMNPGKW